MVAGFARLGLVGVLVCPASTVAKNKTTHNFPAAFITLSFFFLRSLQQQTNGSI
jgi:hypothetical protein